MAETIAGGIFDPNIAVVVRFDEDDCDDDGGGGETNCPSGRAVGVVVVLEDEVVDNVELSWSWVSKSNFNRLKVGWSNVRRVGVGGWGWSLPPAPLPTPSNASAVMGL